MKNIIKDAVITALVTTNIITAFIGIKAYNHMPELDLSSRSQIEYLSDFTDSISDWNTNGQELSIITKDGYEFYSYHKDAENYKASEKMYIPFNNIKGVHKNNTEIKIIDKNGNVYKVNK